MIRGEVAWGTWKERWIPCQVRAVRDRSAEVLLPDGVIRKVRFQDLRFRSTLRCAAGCGPEILERHRAATLDRLDGAREAVADLWELLTEGGERPPSETWLLDDLAAFLGGPDDACAWDALRLALLIETAWFRRRGERFEALPARIVAERKRQAEVQLRMEARRAQVAESLRAALEAAPGPAHLSDEAEETYREAVHLLEVVAAHGCEHPHFRVASTLVAEVLSAAPGGQEAAAIEALVRLGEFGPHENLLIRRHGLPVDFPAEVLAEAERLSAEPPDPSLPLRDALHALAIDDAETRDVDDALAVEEHDQAWVVHVLISDVAGRIPLGSPVAEEARRRAATIYLPDRVIPMLPPALSERALSLRQGRVAQALDFRIGLTRDGRPYDIRIEPVRLSVARQITYAQADDLLSGAPACETARTLHRLHEVATLLRNARALRGAAVWQPDEFKVRVNAEGTPEVHPVPATSPARTLVSELMVLAGHMAARYCVDHSVPAVYRVQSCREEARAAPGTEGERPSNTTLFGRIRGMRPAELRITPGPHEGLGIPVYLQVTSPIRRYQDYVTHIQLRGHRRHHHAPLRPEQILELFARLEETQRTLNKVMRSGEAYWILQYYAGRIGSRVQAEVVGEVGGRVRLFLLDTGHQTLWTPDIQVVTGDACTLEVAAADPRSGHLILRGIAPGGAWDPAGSQDPARN